MEITNKGYINFNPTYNVRTDKFTTASMSFSNGKDEAGNYKRGYINVVAFGELGDVLFNSSGSLVTVAGYFRLKEHNNKKYPEVVITAINGYAPSQSQSQVSSQPGNTVHEQVPNFGREVEQGSMFQGQTTNLTDFDDLGLPF